MPDPKLGKLYDALSQKDPSVVAGLDRENFITKFSGDKNMRKLYEGLKQKRPEFVTGVDADAFVGKFKEVGFWDKIGVGLGTGKVPGKEEEKLAPSMNFAEKTVAGMLGSTAEANAKYEQDLQRQTGEYSKELADAEAAIRDPNSSMPIKQDAYNKYKTAAEKLADKSKALLNDFDKFDEAKFETTLNTVKALQKQLNATSDPVAKQQIQDKLSPHMEYLSTLEQSDNFKNYVKANEALNRSRSLRNALFPEAIKEEAETKARQTAIDKESQATEESGGIISNVTEHLRNLNVDVAQSLFNVVNSLEGMVSPITNKLFSKEAQAEYRAKRLATIDSVNNYLDSYKPSDLKGSYKEEYVPLANGKSIVYDNGQIIYGRDKNGYMYEPTEQEIAEAELAKESKGVKNRRNTKVLGANFQKVVVDLATQIALGRSMGALGVKSSTMATSIPTALQSFGEYYTEAIRAGEDDTTAYASAAAMSVSDALLENIGGLESKLLGKGVGQPILNRAKADVRKKFLEGTIGAKDLLGEYSKYVMSKAGESVKQGVGEVFEEVLQGVGQDALDNAILGSDIDIVNKQIKGFEETALLSFGVGAGASSIKEFATVNTDFKKNIHVNALNQMILDRGNLDNILNSANVTDERRAAVKAQVNYVTNELEARGISDNIQATGLAKLKWDWEYALQEKEADGNMSDTAKAKYTDKIKEIDTALDELAKEKTASSETGDTTEAAEPDTMGGTATNTEGTVESDATTTPLSDDELAAQAAAKQAAQDLFGEDAAEDTPEEDTSVERSVAQRVLLSDVIGDSLFEDANGNVGTVDITEEGEVEFSYGNNVVKLGNTADLGDASVAELGLTPKRVDGEDSGKVFSIGETKYVVDDPSAVTYDKDGKVESVRALRVEDGKTVAVELRGPEAQEIAYRVKLKELYDRDGEENTKSRIAEAVGQLEEVSGDADVAEVEDTKQTRRELPGTSYTTENGRTYTIDSYDKKGNVKFQYEDHNGKTVKGTWDKAEFEGFIADGTLTKSKGNPAPKTTSTPAKGKSTTTTAEPVTEKTVSEAKVASPKKVAAIGRMTIKKGDRVTVRDKEGNVIKRNVEVLEVSPDKKTVKTEFKGKFSVVPIEQIENLDAKSITNAYKEAKKNNTDPELVEAVEALAPKQKTKEKTKEDAVQKSSTKKEVSRTGEGGQDKSKDSAGVGQSKQGKEAAKESKKESIGEVTEEEFVAFKNTGLVSPKRLKSIAAKQDAGEALTEKEKTIAEKKQKDIDKIKEAAVPKEKTKEQLEKEERQRQYEEDLAAAKERAANAPPPPPVVEAPTITVEPTTAKTESPKAPKPKVDTVVKATVKGSSKKSITKFDLRHLQRLHAAGVKFTTKAARSGGLITANVGDVLMNKDGVFFTVQDVSGGRVTGKLSYVNDKGFVSENRNPTDVRVVDISDIDFPTDTSFDIDKQVEQVTKALGKIVPGLTVNVLSDAEYKAKFKDNSRGKYQRKDGKVTITINRDTAKDNTVFHEAAHAVFVHYYGTKSKDIHIIHRTIREALNTSLYPEEQELAKQLDKFIERDPEDIKPHEYLAELVGFLSANRTKLTGTTVGERMVEYLNNMFEKLLGIRPFTAGSDINSIIKLVNNIAVNLAEGQVIEDTIEAAKDTDVELDYSQKDTSEQLQTSQSVVEQGLLNAQSPKKPASKATIKVVPKKQATLFVKLFGKEKGEATNRLVNRIKKNIAKRLGISVNEYNERLVWAAVKSIPTSVNELINSIGGLMAQRDLQEAKVLYQEELLAVNNTYTPSKAMLAKVEGMTEKDVWLAKLIETYQPLRDFINRNYSVQVDQSARERVNTLQAKLATLVKDGKKDSAEFADTKEELEDYKSVIAQEKKGRVNMAAVKTFIASELSSISNIAENSDNYYIKEFPQNVIDDRIDQYKNKDYNPDELLRWEAMLDPQVRADTVAANATAQKADLKGIITYLNNGEYSPEFALYLLNDILAYDYYTKDGNVHKRPRKNDTINSFNLVSPMVVGGMYRDYNGNSQKSAYLEYLSVKKTVKNVDKVFVEDYAKYKVADTRDGFWVKFDKGNAEHYSDLHAAAATTQGTGDWCTGSSLGTATAHLDRGDFYIHLNKEGKATLAIRYEEDSIAEEPRGILDGQNVRPEDSDILADFLLNTAPNGTDFIDTATQNKLIKRFLDNGKQPLMDLTKEEVIFIDNSLKQHGYRDDPNVELLRDSLTPEAAAKAFGVPRIQVAYADQLPYIDNVSDIVVVLGRLSIDEFSNDTDLVNLEYVRELSVLGDARFYAPKLLYVKTLTLNDNSTTDLPALKSAGEITLSLSAKLKANKLEDVEDLWVYEYAELYAPNLAVIKNSASIKLGVKLTLPKLHTAESIVFNTSPVGSGAAYKQNWVNTIFKGSSVRPNTNTKFSFPSLKAIGLLRSEEHVELDFPELKSAHRISLNHTKSISTPKLEKVNNLHVLGTHLESTTLTAVNILEVNKATIDLPKLSGTLTTIRIDDSEVVLPNIEEATHISVSKGTLLSLPNITVVKSHIHISDASTLTMPKVDLISGNIELQKGSSIYANKLVIIGGNLLIGSANYKNAAHDKTLTPKIELGYLTDVKGGMSINNPTPIELPELEIVKGKLNVLSKLSLPSIFELSNGFNTNPGLLTLRGNTVTKVNQTNYYNDLDTAGFFQDNRAAIVKTPNKSIILLSKNADVTSPLHEMAHEFESVLSDSEKKTILKWAGTRTWNTDTSEAFAKGFEKYLYEGKSPSQELKALFEKFANWLKDLLRQADFDGIPDLNEDMRNIYAAMLINESSKQGSAVEPRTAADNMADIELSQDDSQREEILQKMADAKYNVPAQVLYNVRQAKFDALGITVADIKKALGQETPGQESVAAEAEVPVEPTADREQGALEANYHEFVTKVLRSPNVSEEVKEALRTNSPLKDVVTFEELRFMSDKFMEGIETVEQIKKAREVILHTFGKATGTYLSGWQFMALTNLQQLAEAMNQPKLAAKLLETIGSKSVEFGRLIASLKAVESQDLAITILNSKIFDKYNERDYYTGRSPIQAMESFISEILPDDPDVERYLKVLEAKINAAIFDNANSGNIDLSQNGDYDIEKFIKAVLTPKKSGKSTEDLVARSLFAMRRSKNPSTKPDKEVLDELAKDLRKKQVTLAELAEVKALIAAQSMSRSPAEMAQLENAVEDTIAYVTGKSIGHAKLRKAIQDALGISDNSKLKEAIVELARDRVKGEDLGKSLIEQIINRTGVSPETAKKIEDEIRASYNEVLREAVDKKVKEASDKLLRHDIEALEKKLAELKKDPKLDFEAKTVERLLDAAIARKNKHLEKEGDRILKAMSAISLRTAEAKAQADAIEKIKGDTSKTIAQKKKEIDAIKKEQEKTRKILKELKAEEKIAKAEDSKRLNEAYLKEKATLEIEIADIKSDPVLSDPEKEVRIRAVNNRLAKLDKAITKFNEAQETAKDKARTELVWLIDKNKSQKNLLEIFAHDSFTADDVMEHFQKAYKVVPPLTANELRELRRLSLLYKTATREVDKAAAFSRLVEYMTDRIDRTGDKGFLAEVFFEYAYTNLLSSAYTAIKAFTIGVKEFLSTIGFDILSIAPSIISGNLKSNLINVKDAWKAGLAGTRRSGPSLIEGLKTGNVVGQVDSTELHRLLGAGQFLSRQSVRYTSGTYTPSKYKALDALAIVGSVFWRVFSTMSRLLVLADMATKAFTIPYYRTRVAYYQLLKDPTSVGADPTDVSLLASIDRKLTNVTSLEEAVENDAAELGLNFESNFTVPTNTSGNPISGKEYTAWRKGLYEHAKKLGYPLDENLQRLTGAAMAKWKKERLVKLAPEFLTAGLGKMADDAAKSMAQQETATGNIYGTMGSILNPIIDKRHDRETGFFPKFISWIALPFARATGIMINLLLKSLPTGILQTKREGDRTSGKPWELGLRNEMRVMKNGKVDLEKSRSMTQYELSQMYFKAFAPTIMAGLAAAYLFDLEQCEEEDPRLCVKLADRDIRFTGSTKIPTANAEFYGDGWQPNKIQKKVPGTNKWETKVGYQDWAMGTLFSALGNLSDKLRLDPDRLDKKDISGSIGAATKGAVDYFMNFGFESALKVPVDIYNLVSPSYDGSSRIGDAAALAISDRLIRPMIPGSGAWSGIQQTKGTITGSGPGDWRSGEFVKNIVGDGVLSQAVDKVMAKTIFAYKYEADYDVLGYKVETSPRTVLEKIVRTAIHQEPPQPKAWAILNKFPELEGSITYYNPKEKTEEVLGDRNFELFYKNIPKELLYKTRKDATLLKRQMIEKGYEELNANPTPQEVRSALVSINKAANEHAFVANIIASIPALAKENQDIFKTEKKSYPLQIFDDRQLYTKTKLTDYLEREGKIIDNGKLRKSDAVSSEAYKTSEEKKKIINKGH